MKDAVDVLNKEITRLRQENNAAWDSAEYNARRAEKSEKRVAELEEELMRLLLPTRCAPHYSPVIESEWQELQRKYKERGERMKAMREWIENDPEDNGGVSFVEHYGAYKWFDPETGEPL